MSAYKATFCAQEVKISIHMVCRVLLAYQMPGQTGLFQEILEGPAMAAVIAFMQAGCIKTEI
jgi:hypothetical protein